jgi:hypothetical protein
MCWPSHPPFLRFAGRWGPLRLLRYHPHHWHYREELLLLLLLVAVVAVVTGRLHALLLL